MKKHVLIVTGACVLVLAVVAESPERTLTARWIWRAAAGEDDYNRWLLARRAFEVADAPRAANLRVTADTRYQLFINGAFVVDGPVKAYPEEYRYDSVDVARFLRPGTNVVAVRVHHWGRDTAQSVAVRPGLLAQLDWEDARGAHALGTDGAWRVRDDTSHDRTSPQVSAHLGFEEQFDARHEPEGWMWAGFDDAGWDMAEAFAAASGAPWRNLRSSGIPPLAKTVYPANAVLDARRVRPPRVAVAVNLGRCQGVDRKADNRARHRFVLAGILSSDRDQDATLLRPSAGFIFGRIRLSGADVDVRRDLLEAERQVIRLRRGDNPVIIVLDDQSEVEEHQFVLDADGQVTLRAAFGGGLWSVAGPYVPKHADWPRLSAAASLDELELFRAAFRDLEPREVIGADVHALTSHRRVLGPATVTAPGALACDNEQDTVVPPGDEDVELMVDLGREYNAHIGFEIQARAGTVLDGNVFERFHEGVPQWSWRNRSSFRYVAREGWQAYRTMRHFGGRYLALTVRARPDEVRIRRVQAVATHYPVADRGVFFCSDALLNDVWRVCRQTLLSCMEDTFVDCPLYEQSFWLGDARNEALACYALFGEAALVGRCCDLGGESLARGELAAMRVPTRWPRVIPAWSFLWLRMCWEHYVYTGERETLVGLHYPRVRRMLDACLERYRDERTGLFSIQSWQFFDWVDGLDTNHKIVLHNNTFLVDSLRLGATMAELAGEEAVAARYRAEAARLTGAINEHLWDEARGAYVDSLHNDGAKSTAAARPFNTLALLHRVVPPERAERVLAVALGERTEGVTPFGSPFATLYLLELLGETGRVGAMLDVIRELWGGMLDSQTTTFWESFATGNLGGGRYPTRSYCHAWSAGPAHVFGRYLLGATIEEPGGRRIALTPRVDLLDRVEGTVPLAFGEIRLSWRRGDDQSAALTVEASPGILVTVRPPAGWRFDNGDESVALDAGVRRLLLLRRQGGRESDSRSGQVGRRESCNEYACFVSRL